MHAYKDHESLEEDDDEDLSGDNLISIEDTYRETAFGKTETPKSNFDSAG